jgi:hypothetical protein
MFMSKNSTSRPSIYPTTSVTNTQNPPEREILHSLKNNLASVLGYCELILATTDEADPRRGDLLQLEKATLAAIRDLRRLIGHTVLP